MNILERLITGDFHKHEWKQVKELQRSRENKVTGKHEAIAIIYIQECKICGERKNHEVKA